MGKIVVLDKGHGLPDPGAVKYVQEYKVAGVLVDTIKPLLERSGITVVLTRTSDNALDPDKNTDLSMRCRIANDAHADLFVSMHLNCGGGTGYETLCYKDCPEAHTVHNRVVEYLNTHGVKDRGIKERPELYVLNGTHMPALLLENLFVDNEQDVAHLKDPAFFKGYCEAIAKGICAVVGVDYLTEAPKPDPVPEWKVNARNFVMKNNISDGTRPTDTATREEVWAMIMKAMGGK